MINSLQTVMQNAPFFSIFVVFAAGFIASLSSCTIIRIPIVFGIVSGASGSKKHSVLLSLSLVLGLILSYTLLGVFLNVLKTFTIDLVKISKYVYFLLGIILMVAGVYYSGLIIRSKEHDHCKVEKKSKKTSYIGAFAFGVMFAFMEMPACPCCASVMFVIAGIVSLSNNWVYSIIIFLSFAIGQSMPIFLIGSSTSLVKILTPRVEKIEKYVQFAAGTILIVISIFFFIAA